MTDDLDRVRAALDWWASTGPHEPTSSLNGGGAIARLESLLGALLGGRALALPSGSAALRTGLRVLGVGTGSTVALIGRSWFGASAVVTSVGGSVAQPTQVPDLTLAHAFADGTLPRAGVPSTSGTLVDAADVHPKRFRALAAHEWHAAAISMGPGKSIDAGEGGILVVRTRQHFLAAVCMTQHPVRQSLAGVDDIDVTTRNERMHPLAAVVALHQLDGHGAGD